MPPTLVTLTAPAGPAAAGAGTGGARGGELRGQPGLLLADLLGELGVLAGQVGGFEQRPVDAGGDVVGEALLLARGGLEVAEAGGLVRARPSRLGPRLVRLPPRPLEVLALGPDLIDDVVEVPDAEPRHRLALGRLHRRPADDGVGDVALGRSDVGVDGVGLQPAGQHLEVDALASSSRCCARASAAPAASRARRASSTRACWAATLACSDGEGVGDLGVGGAQRVELRCDVRLLAPNLLPLLRGIGLLGGCRRRGDGRL